ncbi:MAG TPA: glycosyl hydrolase [Cyclobacteriaceae bacterium]|nr:glycosyl hydrolase [Cyclobacteriaceae bacterium]
MKYLLLISICLGVLTAPAQKKSPVQPAQTTIANLDATFKAARWRNIGPFRGGRSVTSTGVVGDPLTYYMGSTGGGLWKTNDAGMSWFNISDGYFKTGSVGAVAVAESDPNVIYVGMGEHAPRGVTTSYGDGVYKSTDAGKTWIKMGLDLTRHIAYIRIHPTNPDVVYVAAQGALHGPTPDRGVYKSTDGGTTWKKTLYVDENTGCADLSMDMTNPRILYAAMWDHRRLPWQVISGGKGSGLYKSVDGGETWSKIQQGLPKELGKMSVSVCRSNPEKVYALVESDTQKEQGGLFVSNNGGKSWDRISKDHRLVQRAWYYIEVFADPQNEEIVYVLNSPGLKSVDGGKSWEYLRTGHGDYHQLWINPRNNKNIIISDDGGATITVNNGLTWSTQNNQPTAQFYRVNTDNLFPYRVYGGQQDNTSVMIESRNPSGWAINDHNWTSSAGGESAFIAFNPDDPRYTMGGSYQGTIELLDQKTNEGKGVMIAPIQYQALQPKNMKYRFNWNAPIIWSKHDNAFYHGGNKLFRTTNLGKSWEVISPDLTRNDESKLGISGVPYTNEGAGGENYGTLSYVKDSPNEKGVIWTGSDDGFVHVTRDGGKTWTNVTPTGLQECLINSIEVSPHDNATAYIATTRYKFNDFTPGLFKTTDYGKTWIKINEGIPYGAFTRVVREDDVRKDLLYAGTETGFYISYNGGKNWSACQLNLPVVAITDLMIRQGDLVASTQGRAFWIFDDLSLFRQYDAAAKGFQLFRPEDAVRVSGFSPMDGPANDGEERGPSAPIGTNAPTGVVIYYALPEKVDSAASLTLQIKDAQGAVVHAYSSEADKKFVSFPGGPGPDPTLSKKGGFNRFVWNMRYPSVEGAPNVYIEGSYRGHKAPPGVYTAVLKYGSEEKTTTFSILPNPGIQATAAEYQESHEFQSKVEAGITEIHRAVNQLKEAKRQTEDLIKVLDADASRKEIKDVADALVKKITSWDEKVVQRKSESNDDIINFVNKISADYIFLKGELDSNTPLVSQGAREQLDVLNSLWKTYKAEYDEIMQKDIVNLNTLCKQKGIDKISLPAGK